MAVVRLMVATSDSGCCTMHRPLLRPRKTRTLLAAVAALILKRSVLYARASYSHHFCRVSMRPRYVILPFQLQTSSPLTTAQVSLSAFTSLARLLGVKVPSWKSSTTSGPGAQPTQAASGGGPSAGGGGGASAGAGAASGGGASAGRAS